MVVTDYLNDLKKKILLLRDGKISYKSFDRWLVQEDAKNSGPKVYLEILAELISEIEGIQLDHYNEGDKIPLDEVKFTDKYFNYILSKVEKSTK